MRDLNSDVKALYWQQFDDWSFLITEKMFLTKEKEPGLSADRPSNNCAL